MKKPLLLLALLAPGLAMAQGFQLNLQGTKNIAVGQGGTGWASDAATVFQNPGAVSMLKDNSVIAGVSPTMVRTSYRANPPSQYKAENDAKTVLPFHLMAAWGPKDARWKAGLSVVTPFGSTLSYPDNWAGKYSLQSITLQTISVQPTFSYKITDRLGLGAGLVWTYGNVELQRAIPNVFFADGRPGQVSLSGTANAFSFNAGLFYQLTDAFSLGLNYRSGFTLEVEDGETDFNVPGSLVTTGRFPTGNSFSSELNIPSTIQLGGAYKVNEKLTLIGDVAYVTWSTYSELKFDFAKDASNTPGAAVTDETLVRNYEDSWIFRLGGEYMATEKLATRLGVAYGLTPVQENFFNPDGADANRLNLSAGLGYTFGEHLTVDAAFLFVNLAEREAGDQNRQFYGTWKTFTYVPSIQVGYRF